MLGFNPGTVPPPRLRPGNFEHQHCLENTSTGTNYGSHATQEPEGLGIVVDDLPAPSHRPPEDMPSDNTDWECLSKWLSGLLREGSVFPILFSRATQRTTQDLGDDRDPEITLSESAALQRSVN